MRVYVVQDQSGEIEGIWMSLEKAEKDMPNRFVSEEEIRDFDDWLEGDNSICTEHCEKYHEY